MHNFYHMMVFHKIHHFKHHIEHFWEHGQVLTALLQKGPMTQGELLLPEDIPLNKILPELKKHKLIKYSKQDDVISLTKKGNLFAKRVQMHNHFILNMSESLSDEEKDQLAAILEKLRSNAGGEEFSHFHFRGSHFGFDRRGHDHHGHIGGEGK